jgi:glycosyltransferase involved in cell wall biosynthesis
MRVVLLSHNANVGDAIGNNVAEKVAFFRERAADVRVFVESARGLHPDVAPFCEVVQSAEPGGECWRYLRSADLVCAEFGQYYPLLALLPLLAGGKQRVILDYHGITPPELWGGHNREALVQGLEQRGLAWCADASITHSSFTQEELAGFTGLPLERLPRFGYVVDRSRFTPGPAGQAWRRSLGLVEARVMLFVGRLAPNKRPVLLAEALHHLADVKPAVHAVLVGDNTDLYHTEAERCRERARQLGVADRLHLVGPQLGSQLRDFYRGSDVLVHPSLWESFCIPVVEAMACGLPVVAARTTCLPETIGSAGLTFVPDDGADLARQVRRVLGGPAAVVAERPRLAVVACRWGRDFASGAERSLERMAHALHQAGCDVEVFTTTTRSETGGNELAPGSSSDGGLSVSRFTVDKAAGVAEQGDNAELPPHPIHSAALLQQLEVRVSDFDVLLTGPYLAGLTIDVARRWPDKTVVVPCFHDEPEARHQGWAELFERTAGLLYHSPEEQSFAERVVGVNHPASAVVGTWVDISVAGQPERGREAAGCEAYALYCGRYAQEKDVPLLIEYARRFAQEHPGRIRFVFTGQGDVVIPREPWAVDFGFVAEDRQRDLLAGAIALVQLSSNESLSLAALESWAQGTPVIAHRKCSVLTGHMERSGGGCVVDSYEGFAEALLGLLDIPGMRDHLGNECRQYVATHYGSGADFQERLLRALGQRNRPLAECMRERGLQRAAASDRAVWRERFGAVVENVLDAESAEFREAMIVQPRAKRCDAEATAGSILVGFRVVNRGTHMAVGDGPGRSVVTATVVDGAGRVVARQAAPTALPGLLMPGRAMSGSVLVPVPRAAGDYEVRLAACRWDRLHEAEAAEYTSLELTVHGDRPASATSGYLSILDDAQAALVEAKRLEKLPQDYTDVTQGVLATVKHRIKQKLLGNFKKAYVDVLSRQQSACNQQLVEAIQTLTECCATLDHAVRQVHARLVQLEGQTKDGRQDHSGEKPVTIPGSSRQPAPTC